MAQQTARKMAEAPVVNAWSTKSTVPFFRIGNYAPVFDELTTFDLPVEGAIPAELNGWYLRNDPNPRHGHETPHWFTGDGMIHGVRLENGAPPGTAIDGRVPRALINLSCFITVTEPVTCTPAWRILTSLITQARRSRL